MGWLFEDLRVERLLPATYLLLLLLPLLLPRLPLRLPGAAHLHWFPGPRLPPLL